MLQPKSERIHQARRAAHVARLASAGWPEDAAEAAVAAWEAQADAEGRQRGAAAFWDGAETWMVEWRRRQTLPLGSCKTHPLRRPRSDCHGSSPSL